ncbi:caspase-3 isoform X2 [Biomphalaria glabrata]|nr:caspase-3 isoform X2 [Biomphalaria glabrata]
MGISDIQNDIKMCFCTELDGFLSAIKTKLKKFACGFSSLSPTTSPPESADFSGTTALNSFTTKLRTVKVMLAEEDSDVYNFDYPKRGLALIVNNENFSASKDFSNRLGSDYDAKSLTDTFSRLGFEVMLENNLTSKRMALLFPLVSKNYDHSNADCFVCVVLTHGDQAWLEREYCKTKERYDLLFGVDGNPIATKAVVEAFNDENCPNLKGKPRMFFFQACRGSKLDDGTDIRIVRDQYTYNGTSVLSSTASSTVSVDGAGQLESTHSMGETDSKLETFRDVENDQSDALPWSVMRNIPVSPAPLFKDCLVMYATPPGFLSWRRETGSWFIQSLCGVLDSSKMRDAQEEGNTCSLQHAGQRCFLKEKSSGPATEHVFQQPDHIIKIINSISYYAWRRRTGAWFIQSLCMILSHSGLGAMSFLKALVLVSKNVAFNYTSDNPAKPSMDAKKVVPVIQSMLVKDIFMTAKKLK